MITGVRAFTALAGDGKGKIDSALREQTRAASPGRPSALEVSDRNLNRNAGRHVMRISQKDHGDVLVVSVGGNITGGPDADKLRSTFHNSVEGGRNKIVVDLKKVSFVDSIGLGILIGGWRRASEAGGGLVIAHASDRVRSLYYHTKINLLFETFDSEEDALAHFNNA